MTQTMNNETFEMSITIQNVAEMQVLLNALEQYRGNYLVQFWDNEKGKLKDGFNKHHYELAEKMYKDVVDEYTKDVVL